LADRVPGVDPGGRGRRPGREPDGGFGILVEKDVAVPMRDGVVLRANVFRPADEGKYPAILTRTPYSKERGTGIRGLRRSSP
jgi:predicted acyl esterase